MTELKQVDPKDLKKQTTICEVYHHGPAPYQCVTTCELAASEFSECVVVRIQGTNTDIKIKKTALLNIMGFGYDYKKFMERI